MLGAAIVQDLVAISQERQHGEQRPALVIIDEFSAFGAPQTQRLFGRGRGAWLSQLLGTQEVADLGPNDTNVLGAGGGILAQVAGNIEVLLCGRQNMPASAELVAAIAGTRGAWITTQQTACSGRRSADRIGLTIARPGVRSPSGHDQEARRRRVRCHRPPPSGGP